MRNIRTTSQGIIPVSIAKAINAYVRSVEGNGRGEIIRIYE